ncbi:MAG: ribosome small subunit-dependent GTPase A [Gammaproteobacteria bacterium]
MSRRPARKPEGQAACGTVVAVFGRRYEVAGDDGLRYDCVPRGKQHVAVCGDRVAFGATGAGGGVIDTVLARRNYLERSDAWKRKGIAANVDQVLVLVAVEPHPSEEFVARVQALARAAEVPMLLALNKVELPGAAATRVRIEPFAASDTTLLAFSAKPRDGSAATARDVLLPRLLGRTTVLLGQSGMGKSSLVNALVPDAGAVTGELSSTLSSGRHTTTFSRLYTLDAESALIDCPGMQEVGIHHVPRDVLAASFAEFAPHLGRCRFANCRHDQEPDCALRAQVAAGAIRAERLALFVRLAREVAA